MKERNSPNDIIPAILNHLRNGSTTLSELSKDTKINRVTLSLYLDAFKKANLIKKRKNGREQIIFLNHYDDSYFDLPIRQSDKKEMKTIYAIIRRYCQLEYKKEPTKTHVYKILYELAQEENLKVPVGWYQHGHCSVLIYSGNESELMKLPYENKIKEKVQEFCKLEPVELQKQIYKKYKNKLYQFKEDIRSVEQEQINDFLMQLLKLTPQETIDVTTDFIRATMLLGWDQTKDIFFKHLWKYIATIEYKESLKNYYGDEINDLLK